MPIINALQDSRCFLKKRFYKHESHFYWVYFHVFILFGYMLLFYITDSGINYSFFLMKCHFSIFFCLARKNNKNSEEQNVLLSSFKENKYIIFYFFVLALKFPCFKNKFESLYIFSIITEIDP